MNASNKKINYDEITAVSWPNNKLVAAVDELKLRLQARYERFLPGEKALIRKALEEAESIAWSTQFPHLFLPDLVEEGIARIIPASRGDEADAGVFAHAA